MLHLLGDRRSGDGRFHWFWILCWQRVKTWSLCRRIGWRCSGQRWHVVVFLEGPARLSIAPAVLENLRAPPPPGVKICLRRLWNPASQRAEHVSHWPHAETVHGARSLRPARNSSPGLLPPGSADDATTPPKPAQKTSAWTPLCMGRYPAWTKPLRCSTTTHVQGACTCTYAPSLSPPNPNKSPHPWGAG